MKSRIIKVLSWRLVSVVTTTAFMWAVIGDVKEATVVSISLHVLLTFLNYGFELFWDRNVDRRYIEKL